MAARTFLALDVSAAVRERLASIAGALGGPGATIRPVPAGNIHVTLNFLGDVADDVLPDVCGAVQRIAAAVDPFDFAVRGVRCMPPRGRVRIVWADAGDADGRLAKLQSELTGAMSALGFQAERREYHPHLTLARVKYVSSPGALREAVGRHADEDFAPQRADYVTTYTSRLTGQGAMYTAASRAPLGG